MKRSNINMLNGPILSNILLYTLPIIATGLLQLLFNAADLVIVGQFCGSISVGAVGATGSITNLIVNLFIGLSTGAGVTVAHAIGGHKDTDTYRAIHTAIPIALIGGVILTVVGVGFAETFLVLMDTPSDILPLSTVYMKIYFAGITFTLIYNFCAAILRAAGDTKSPLIYLAIAGVINVILNVIFVTVFHMNVAGVALATVISQGFSAIMLLILLMRRKDACRLYLNKIRIYKEQLMKIIRIGLPAGIQSSLFSISNVIIQSSINSFGGVMTSGNAAAGNIEGFVYISMNAFHQTSVNFVGQNEGAHQYDRVKKIFWTCMACVSVTGIAAGGLLYCFAPQLLSIYITDSAQAISYGITRMTYVCLPYFICGMMDVATGALRGLGESTIPMLISVLGICGFRVAWIYTVFRIPQFHTPDSLYISYPISWFITLISLAYMFFVVCRKKMRRMEQMRC